LYSGGKNRRGRGIGLPSRGQGPHLGCPPSRVNSIIVQLEPKTTRSLDRLVEALELRAG
jgi:hypothetical protein